MDLFDDPMLLEDRQGARVQRHLLGEVGGDLPQVLGDQAVDAPRVRDEPAVLLVGEQVAYDADGELGLLVQDGGRLALLRPLLDVVPDREQPAQIGFERLLARGLGGGPHDHPVLRRFHPLQQRLEPRARLVGEPAADPLQILVGREDQEPAREAEVGGEPRALPAHRVLRDLDHDGLTGLEQLLDPRRAALDVLRRVVHLARVEDPVPAAADVDEGRLHPGEHVLHAAEVDVADHRGRARPGHVVLDQNVLL